MGWGRDGLYWVMWFGAGQEVRREEGQDGELHTEKEEEGQNKTKHWIPKGGKYKISPK